MPDHSEAIAELEEVLNASATSTSVDGMSESIDLNHAKRRLAILKAEHDGDANTAATKKRRTRFRPYHLG